jgi:hypothetical protein
MTRWHRLTGTAWESLVIGSLVGAAFFVFSDPRLRGSEEALPPWLSSWPIAYGTGLTVFWMITALVLTAHAYLLRQLQA